MGRYDRCKINEARFEPGKSLIGSRSFNVKQNPDTGFMKPHIWERQEPVSYGPKVNQVMTYVTRNPSVIWLCHVCNGRTVLYPDVDPYKCEEGIIAVGNDCDAAFCRNILDR